MVTVTNYNGVSSFIGDPIDAMNAANTAIKHAAKYPSPIEFVDEHDLQNVTIWIFWSAKTAMQPHITASKNPNDWPGHFDKSKNHTILKIGNDHWFFGITEKP